MNHREAIGGMWDQIGELQFRFLVENGMKPEHYLLDIGCGSLRGGTKFINYLNPQHYFALEKEEKILKEGIENELAGRADLFTYHLTGEFMIPEGWPQFDFMLAQSVFTHLFLQQIEDCLVRVRPFLKEDGQFYATFFDSKNVNYGNPHGWRKNERDVARYPFNVLSELGKRLYYNVELVNYDHPRGQSMILFTRDANYE